MVTEAGKGKHRGDMMALGKPMMNFKTKKNPKEFLKKVFFFRTWSSRVLDVGKNESISGPRDLEINIKGV